MTPDEEDRNSEPDLLSGISDLELIRHLIAEMHDDLPGRVQRFRYLADLGGELGSEGTLLFGGTATFSAWGEARSSFVQGNYVATILLCQSLVENLLAAFLHAGLMMDDLPPRIAFKETLKRCGARGLITGQDTPDLERLMNLRNPLSHFRTMDDGQNLDRRALASGLPSDHLLRRDAWFAIALAVRILAKPQFRLG